MAIQQINLGSAPAGTGGDTQRAANTKINQNFSNSTHAASRLVGENAGNVMEVGAFGWGHKGVTTKFNITTTESVFHTLQSGMYHLRNWADSKENFKFTKNRYDGNPLNNQYGGHALVLQRGTNDRMGVAFHFPYYTVDNEIVLTTFYNHDNRRHYRLFHDNNCTTDGNGFLKASSPVVDLYDSHVNLNYDAETQGVEFIKNGKGDYTLKTKTGLRSDSTWQIEIPHDNNKNPLFAVDIDAQDGGTINIRCYKRIFSMETFLFGPDFNEPMDITEGRFISVRLNDNPEEQLDESIE